MVFLVLSIVCSSLLNVIFKLFAKFKINTFQAIVVNYFICFVVGSFFSGFAIKPENFFQDWFIRAFILGGLFMLIFFCMAKTIELLGISVNAVSSKMAVVLPISFTVLFLNGNFNTYYLVGIVLSLISIVLITWRKKSRNNPSLLIWPIIVFLGSGVIDISLKWLEHNYSDVANHHALTVTTFFGAFCFGLIIAGIRVLKNQKLLKLENLIAGIALGIPNYFSIAFLLKALNINGTEGALVFGINNVGIVVLSSFLSITLFREKLSKSNYLGLAIAILAIVILTYGRV